MVVVAPGDIDVSGVKLPQLTCRVRSFEFVAAVITGMVFMAKILKPPVVFISCCTVLWTGWLIFQCRRHGRQILFLWGLRVDNLPRSLVLPSFFAVFAILIISLVSVGDGRDVVAPFHTWRFWLMMALYPLWGVLVQATGTQLFVVFLVGGQLV